MYLNFDCKVPYAYFEMGRLCVKESSLHFINNSSDIIIPPGRICAIFLGPGTTITHKAIKFCMWANATLVWVGEELSKCYSASSCQTRSSENFLKQVYLHEHKKPTLLKKYYFKRFGKNLISLNKLSEEKIRGMEGAKMRKIYFEAALKYGIPYSGRTIYGDWTKQTAYDKAISIINSFLYGICASVINALGYSTALGLLHSGNMMSFTFDIADLYKSEFSIPLGFEIAMLYKKRVISDIDFEKQVRRRSLSKFQENKLLERILTDLEELLDDSGRCKKSIVSDKDDPIDFSLSNIA
jgi:CRISP-associated protein Cas1